MEVIKNPNVKQAIKLVTIAGASVLVVGSALSLLKAKSLKESIMPVVAILVGVSAFGYAMNKKVASATTEQKSNAAGSTPRGSASKMAQVPCNQGGNYCAGGRECKNGFCI